MQILEKLMLQMGIDNSDIKAGMRRFDEQVAAGAKSTAAKISSSFRQAFSGVLAGFSVGALAAKMGRIAEQVDEIGDVAGALQISPKFLQDLQNIAVTSGVRATS